MSQLTVSPLKARYRKMSSKAMLARVAKGGLTKKEAKIAANILEKRFPSPNVKKGGKSQKVAA